MKSVFHNFLMVADLFSPNRCHWQIAKVKTYSLNVTEIFPIAFPEIFNFTVGILVTSYHTRIFCDFIQFNLQARTNVLVTDCYIEKSLQQKLDKIEKDLQKRVNELKSSKIPSEEEFKTALNDIRKSDDFEDCNKEFDLVKLQRLKTFKKD